MKRNHILRLAFLAVFAFSAVLAASASAEETLLAEWLINGAAVVELTSVQTSGLAILKAGTDVIDCEGLFNGSIGPNGEGEVTEVLNSGGVKIGAPLVQPALECPPQGENTCTNNPVLEWPVNLPWLTNLELMTVAGLPPFLVHLFKDPEGGAAQPGWEVECTLLGVKITQECTGLSSSSAENAGTDVIGRVNPAPPIESEKVNCTFTGAGTGEIEGEGLTALLGAGTLTVSSV